jgi:aryl-phospho-beta-D-glucosidase BglC (GH1 family)
MMKLFPAAHRLRFLSTVLLCALGSTAVRAMPPELKVAGTQLVDAATGQPVRLRGVNCASLEWSADGEGHIAKSVQVAVTEWHANLIRLPLSQDSWFGKGTRQADGGGAYRALVKELVDFCAAHDAYILLDLHWSDGGDWGENIGQHNLPDRNSLIFWKDVAKIYRDDPAVLFDLYNEPNRTDWDTWHRGGEVTETDERTKEKTKYKAVGMQALIDAIRSVGAKNVVVASGINWACELEGIPAGHALADPRGRGVVYAIHVYPHAFENLGRETIAQVTARIEAFAKKFPVLVGEFGSNAKEWPFPKDSGYTDEKWNREFLAVLEDHGWNWAAWDFHPFAGPCLIGDWNYTPTPPFGALVKEILGKNEPTPAAAR